MRVILSKQCLSLTGMLERGLGYHLVERKNGFIARRNSKGSVPPDGHLRFIFLCAELAQNKLHIADIRVPYLEMYVAVQSAGHTIAVDIVRKYSNKGVFNAIQVMDFKNAFGL